MRKPRWQRTTAGRGTLRSHHFAAVQSRDGQTERAKILVKKRGLRHA